MGVKASNLGLYNKHPAYYLDWNVDMCFLNMRSGRNVMVNSDFFGQINTTLLVALTLRPKLFSFFLCLLPFLLSFQSFSHPFYFPPSSIFPFSRVRMGLTVN